MIVRGRATIGGRLLQMATLYIERIGAPQFSREKCKLLLFLGIIDMFRGDIFVLQ